MRSIAARCSGALPHRRSRPAQFTREAFGNFAFCFPPRGQFIGYPLAGKDDSHEAGRRADLLTDDEGVTHEYSIPPPLIRSEHSDALKQQATALLPPMFSEVVERAQRYMVRPIYVRCWSEADMARPPPPYRPVADDPQRT